jgi:WD40 repeat protein
MLGQVAEAEAVPLEAHLSGCERCQALLGQLEASDGLVEILSGGQKLVADLPRGEAVEALMHRLHSLHPTRFVTSGGAPGDTPVTDAGTEIFDLLAPPQAPGELGRLGPHRIVKVLGAGGMGVVFQAEDLQLRRWVALKVMKTTLPASASARERFLREARAVAAIEHDHIVPIFQVGEDRGVPFLAMPLLQGESLDDRLVRERRLPLGEVLRIGRETAAGLAAAHEHGIVHRDVKPRNIWLEGSRARVRLLDFGLARPAIENAPITHSGVIVGTPAYMAPEQARGGTVDARADLFSLGCVLYHLATGEVPFKGSDTLSTLAALAADRPRVPREINPAVPPALSDLVMQLLARDPAGRPASAAAVIRALEAIEREQTEPPPQPAAPRRRRRLLAAVAAAVLLAALGGAGYLFGPTVIRIATDRGEVVLRTDDPGVEVTVRQGGKVVVILDRKTQQQVELPSGEYEVALNGDPGGLRLSATTFTLKRGATRIVTVERQPVAANPPPAQKPAEQCPADALRRDQISPYELGVVGGGDPGKAPAELVAVLGDCRLQHGGWVSDLAFSPDGKTLASCGQDRTVRLWDAATGQLRHTLVGHQEGTTHLAFSPDSKTLASSSNDRTIKLWDVATGQEKATLQGHTAWVGGLAFSPDGTTLASGSGDLTARLWDAPSGRERRVLPTGQNGGRVAFSPDGSTLAVAGDHFVTRWDVASGEQVEKSSMLPLIEAPDFSQDGRLLASGGPDNVVKLWNLTTGKEQQTLPGHSGILRRVAFSPDGRLLASGGRDNLVKLWDLTTGKDRYTFRGNQGSILSLAFTPDAALLASAGDDGTVRLWDLSTGMARFPSRGHSRSVATVAFSPDGRTLASGSFDHTIRLWDAASGKELRTLKGHQWEVSSVAFSPDGQALASGSPDATVILWDPASAENRRTLEGHTGSVTDVAWSPDSRTLASASVDQSVRLWDPATGKELRTLQGHTAPVLSVAFSPDGRTVAAGSNDETVKRWDAATGEELRPIKGRRLAFSPDGKTLATAVEPEHVLKLWDASTGDEVLTFHGPGAEWTSLAFSPDGQALAATGTGSTLYVWDLTHSARAPRMFPLGVGVWLNGVAFSPEGRHLATGNQNGTVSILRLAPPERGAGR